MASSFKIQSLPSLLSLQVSQFSPIPMVSTVNFISRSTVLPQFRVSIPFYRLHCLSLSSSPISVSENSSIEHSFEVSYLINKFGWSPEFAISKTKYLKFKTPEKPERVLDFFKKHGFTETQISLIVKKYPRYLIHADPERAFQPKLEFLSSLGFSTTEVTGIITKQPYILMRSMETIVIPNFNFLCKLVNSEGGAVELIKRSPIILCQTPEVDNVQILLEAGVPVEKVIGYMTRHFQDYPPTPDSFRKTVEDVKEMGFDPCSLKFISAVLAIKSTSEDRVQVLKKYGWSDREILLAFEKYPSFISASMDKIERVMDFLVNTMGVEATDVTNFPYVFLHSLEKKIVPRCLVFQSLLEKGLRKKKVKITTLLHATEAEFLTKYVKPYQNEAPELWDSYKSLMRQGSLSLSSSPSPFSVSEYLISTFRWSRELAISKAKHLKFKTPEKPERVLALFKKHGFTETQISLIFKRYPNLLSSNPEKTILPKFDFLCSLGLSTTEITDAVTKAPKILKFSLESTVKPSFKLLRSLVNSDAEAVKMVIEDPLRLTQRTEGEDSSTETSFEVSYLINTFGWPPEVAISKAKYAKFETPEKPERVLDLFKKHGFTETQISLIVKKYPRYLIHADPERAFQPKLEFLSSLGFSTTEVTGIITKQPYILMKSMETIVIPNFNFLCRLVNSEGGAVELIKRSPIILSRTPEVDNVQILLEAGVPVANVIVYMTRHAKQYMPTPDSLRKWVEEVKEMGFDPCSLKFLSAVLAIKYYGKSSSEDRVQVFKKYGWSDGEILLAFEKYPRFITASMDKIERVMDFLVNRMGVEATDVADFPYIFFSSLEKTIVPRCLVFQSLLEKGLRKEKAKISTLVCSSEAEFLTKYVKPYQNEAPELLDLYKSLMRQGSKSKIEVLDVN